MKSTRVLALVGVAAILAASRLVFVSSASAAPTSLSSMKVEKLPGPDFQPASYFANQRAAYQRDKLAHPEKFAATNSKEFEWFFTGKPYDADSKSYLFLFRNYRPDSASWMQPDPAGFPDGPNNYAYAPVPTYNVDKFGLAVYLLAHDAIGYGTGGNSTSGSSNGISGRFQHTFLYVVPDANPNGWFTLGASPSGSYGYVQGGFDRGFENPNNPQNNFGQVTEPESDADYCRDLLTAFSIYCLKTEFGSHQSDVPYEPVPWLQGGYNSNSWTHGILNATGGTAPSFGFFVNGKITPGWGDPIPSTLFTE